MSFPGVIFSILGISGAYKTAVDIFDIYIYSTSRFLGLLLRICANSKVKEFYFHTRCKFNRTRRLNYVFGGLVCLPSEY